MSGEKARVLDLVIVPAVIALAVTVIRLIGELNEWSETLFRRSAGGAGAVVGIAWLVPIFGIYFAIRLTRRGQGGEPGKTLAWSLASAAAFGVVAWLGTLVTDDPLLGTIGGGVAALVALFIQQFAWPALFRTLLWYGIFSRIPVMAVMLAAMYFDWGTHYDVSPESFPVIPNFVVRWFWLGLLPQGTFWIAFTVVVGSIFAAITGFFLKRGAEQAPADASPEQVEG